MDKIATCLGGLKSAAVQDASIVAGVDKLIISVFGDKIKTLGFEYTDADDHMTVLKRNLVINELAGAKEPSVVAELKARFVRAQAGDVKAVHPNLRGATYKVVLSTSESPAEDFEAIKAIFKNGDTVDNRLAALGALGAINDLKIASAIPDMCLDADFVKMQDMMYPLFSLVRSSPFKTEILDLLWNWLVKNWPLLHEKLSPSLSLLGSVVRACVSGNIGDEFPLKVEAWRSGADCETTEAKDLRVKQMKDAARPLDQSLESIRGLTAWINRDKETVQTWLVANQFSASL